MNCFIVTPSPRRSRSPEIHDLRSGAIRALQKCASATRVSALKYVDSGGTPIYVPAPRNASRISTLLRVERDAADWARRTVDARVEQFAEIGRLDEHVPVPDAMDGDGKEEHGYDSEKDQRRRRGRWQRREARGDEELLREDQAIEREREKNERGKYAAGLHGKIRPQRQ